MSHRIISVLSIILFVTPLFADDAAHLLRAPAYPLIVHDPYFSVWSFGDKLTDVQTTHWTGKPQPICGTITIDGETFRFMGAEPNELPVLEQRSVFVKPTETQYVFAKDDILLTVSFRTPAIPNDIDLLSRPLTYVVFSVIGNNDGRGLPTKGHKISIRLTVDPLIAVNTPEQEVVCETVDIDGLSVLRVGSSQQQVLGKHGDDLRIDWGHFYLATEENDGVKLSLVQSGNSDNKSSSAKDAPLLTADLNFEITPGNVPKYDAKTLIFAYDDVKSIRYFGKDLLPYWKRNGTTITDLLKDGASKSIRDYVFERCTKFDKELLDDLEKIGGRKYAELCSLAYRQTWGANKIVAGTDNSPYMFSKENFSNGCIGTVDVLYPHTPFLLFFSPALLKGSVVPVFNYAESADWKYGYAPHDLGQYPFATGQVYGMGGGDGSRMPVEESGNMLIIIAALAKVEGNADLASKHWDTLTKWADYLVKDGYDPDNQLCSADMFGHLAHVTNLSLKAIIAIGAYAQLCETLGKTEAAAKYRRIAEEYAKRWLVDSRDDGRTRLAFDKPDTWSMKHNLVWDTILETNLFPASFAEQEIAWYKKVQNKYGLPVDSRTDNSLIDWVLWSITPAKSQADFDELFNPIYNYVNETPNRVPLSDWFITTNAKKRGFQARSVVGGVYIKMLTNKQIWKKYVDRAEKPTDYKSDYPRRRVVTEVVPTSQTEQTEWKFTLQQPPENWTDPNFDDSAWQIGKAGFGNGDLPRKPKLGTTWNTKEIWLRRTFELKEQPSDNVVLSIYYDEDPTIWLNGILAAKVKGYSTNYAPISIHDAAKKTLKVGKSTIAVKAVQTYGGQYIDVGMVEEREK